VPASRFEETVRTVRSGLVVLSAQQLVTAATLQQTATSLAARGVNIAYGGRIFHLHPDLQTRIPGRFLGGQLAEAVKKVEALFESPAPSQPVVLPGPDYVEGLQAFLAGRSALDAALDANARALNMPLEYADTATHFLGDNIAASLRLGDIAYLNAEIDWLKTLLTNYKLPLRLLHEYFKIYLSALRQLGGHIALLETWLERQVEETLDW